MADPVWRDEPADQDGIWVTGYSGDDHEPRFVCVFTYPDDCDRIYNWNEPGPKWLGPLPRLWPASAPGDAG